MWVHVYMRACMLCVFYVLFVSVCISGPQPMKRLKKYGNMNKPYLFNQFLIGKHLDCLQLFLLLQTVLHIFVHDYESIYRKFLEVLLV